ncbi:MAG: serine/threonine-protein kinase HipA, partial [Campylobacterota bacterium]|nr:serine/threonine-protein kinase HipA [Campylobacterota bacterium]
MNKLDVFFNNELIAHVTYSAYEDKYEFLYKDSWKESGFELSPHLSFDKDASSKTVKNFIENLLPEGRALDDIVRFNNLSKNNHFAILGAIGSETAGAITFISEQSRAEDLFREVSLDELGERVKQREFQSIAVWDGKVRVSIAGVQDKLPLVIIDGKIGFGEGKYASTHILKFGNQREENI